MNDKPTKIEMVTLKQLCAELKVDPREARERLRLSVRPRAREVTQAGTCVGVAEELGCAHGSAHGIDCLGSAPSDS
jgi:hypothetical protein